MTGDVFTHLRNDGFLTDMQVLVQDRKCTGPSKLQNTDYPWHFVITSHIVYSPSKNLWFKKDSTEWRDNRATEYVQSKTEGRLGKKIENHWIVNSVKETVFSKGYKTYIDFLFNKLRFKEFMSVKLPHFIYIFIFCLVICYFNRCYFANLFFFSSSVSPGRRFGSSSQTLHDPVWWQRWIW